MAMGRTFIQNRLRTVLLTRKWERIATYCTIHKEDHEIRPKTITEKFAESIKIAKETKKVVKARESPAYEGTNRLIKPVDGYTPRFKYNGYLRKSHWRYYDENRPEKEAETEEQFNYRMLKKHKYCLLMGFAGGNYFGMQFNESVNTIEDELLKVMVKNKWILPEHLAKPWTFDFVRGSRTDRGVSAARMNVSMVLPTYVNVNDLNRDLPSDIRVFGMKKVTPKFSARFNCTARTYSYTLPTIAFSHYNDQTEMKDFRLTADRLQRANQILGLYKGMTNFHNYTVKKLFFDRSSLRHIEHIECSEPFIENDIEFARITVKGQSFMLHQIRKMVGFSLAVIREVVGDDMLQRSLTKEEFLTPTAPGLGLMLERLHFDHYANFYKDHDPLTFEEFDADVEKFRHEHIYPIIVETEIREKSMVEWLEYLCIHSFDSESKDREENRKYRNDPRFSDEWGESPEFIKKLNKRLNE
ncbi:pseudouridylate synthase 1 homolog isoform X2 [Sitodiplosis mosellana]|uniref:pseudouridylate synthase 1 homolog isoform X2 n=1 Tax=Sitodiplosis mosellana TaxID=263140 RepID=UPI002443DB4A|nr:pseudouridylate synthase 1 homolog isoform X2 [Sitodiplosis mosellana]